MTRIFDYQQQISPGTPVFTVVDQVRFPADIRGRAYAGITNGGFDGTLNVNYVDDYANVAAVGGSRNVEAWTTFDLNLAYDFSRGDGGEADNGVRLSLSVQNLFDKDPPFVGYGIGEQAVTNFVGFDSANANPLGRFVIVGLSKTW